jgi:hypothetical protein
MAASKDIQAPYILMPEYRGFKQEREVGEYIFHLPDPPSKSKILNYKNVTSNQCIERIIDDREWGKLDSKGKEVYYNQIADYRENGIWMYNNGQLEYLTGEHFFYLNIYYGAGRYMQWTDSDRDVWYFDKLVEDDPMCIGGIVVGPRRWGKSHRAASKALNKATSGPDMVVGMQSKTDTDVYRDLFMKVVNGYRRMPEWLRPISASGTNPKEGLAFAEPSRRSAKEKLTSDNIFLNSFIDYRASNVEAYDGAAQHFNIQDEIFKKQKANIEERLKVISECVMDSGKVIGKILATSTVEEIDGEAGLRGENIWKKADPFNLNEYGQSANRFKRYFNPAFYGLRLIEEARGIQCMDDYGYSMQENAVKYFEQQRKLQKGKDLSDYKRKYPFSIKEAFANRTQTNPFDVQKINEQMEWNDLHADTAFTIVQGDFVEDPSTRLINWFPHSEGRWKVIWMPPVGERNKVGRQGIHNIPGNYFDGVIGVDPVAQRTVAGKGSDFSATIFRRTAQLYDNDSRTLGVDEMSNMPVAIYRCRLPDIDIHHKDIENAARFYGYPVNAEKNAILGLNTHFAHSEYSHYLLPRVKISTPDYGVVEINDNKGTANYSQDERSSWLFLVASYIYNNCGVNDTTGRMGKIYFNELLVDLRDLDPADWSPYDAFVGFLYAIMAVKSVQPPKQRDLDIEMITIPRYRVVNGKSVKV